MHCGKKNCIMRYPEICINVEKGRTVGMQSRNMQERLLCCSNRLGS